MPEIMSPSGYNELKLCRYGPLLFNKNDWPIGESLKVYGEYAWEELELLSKFIKPDDIVVDAGANIGTHTVWMAKLAEKGCVVSFEPQRIAYQTLCANSALNNCLNVHAFHSALGDRCGLITVPLRDQYKRNNFGGVPLAGASEGEETPICTLDSIGLKSCALIKADVEGMEAELLRGAKNTIDQFRPFLYLEADGAQSAEAIQMLFDMDYSCYWSLPLLYNPDNFEGFEGDIFKRENSTTIVSINILCIPNEKNIEILGLKKVMAADEKPKMEVIVYLKEPKN